MLLHKILFVVIVCVTVVGAFVPQRKPSLPSSSAETRPAVENASSQPIVSQQQQQLLGQPLLYNMKKKNAETIDNNAAPFWETLKDKPGTLVIFPFVLLLGADLVLNLAFVVKRTLAYFVLGQAPSTETWW